jgi:plastocyanin
MMRGHRIAGLLAAAGLLVAAGCDDDDDAGADTTTARSEGGAADTTAPATDDATTTAAGDAGDADPEYAEICAVAEEIYDSDDFPTTDQLERYQAAAPDEIAGAVAAVATPLIAAGDDVVAQLIVFAQDEFEQANVEINAFEAERCGLEHDPPPEQGPADGAAIVEVSGTEYAFEAPAELDAGLTTFVLTNNGSEAHFLGVFRAAEGHTVQEALEYEGDAQADGIIEEDFGGSGLAAPGGDEEYLTVDLEPGTYGIYCFLPDPDGTPHVLMGMQGEITVT